MKFVPVIHQWSQNTFILYLSIILGCYFISVSTQKTNLVIQRDARQRHSYPAWLLLIGIVLLFFKAFGTAGRDLRAGYFWNFLSATSMADFPDQTVEVGFRLLTVAVRKLTSDYGVFIFLLGVLSIGPVIRLLNKYRSVIDVPTAVLLYTTVYFFSGFSQMRQCLAASIALYAFDAMLEKKALKAFLMIMLAASFHTVALVLVVPYGFSMMKLFNRRLILFAAVCGFAMVYLLKDSIAAVLGQSDRYYIYSSMDSAGFGLEQLVYHIPLFFVFYKGRKWGGRHFAKVSISYLATAFLVGMLGYVITILGRSYSIFLPMILIMPYYIRIIKLRSTRVEKTAVNILVVGYCILRFLIYITQYYNMDDLMPYTNIFGWCI